MPGQARSTHSDLAKVVERQMRNWELTRSQRTAEPSTGERMVEDFVTISRAVGSGGAAVAHLLGQKLNWPVFDKEILQAMAGDDDIRRQLYESLDERDLNWFEDTVRSLVTGTTPRNDYFRQLTGTILALARQGRTVFLGRSADLILPKHKGLRVRIVAPSKTCLLNYAKEHKLSPGQAGDEIGRIEDDREEFVRNHFHINAADPCRHDLIINLERTSVEDAVCLIMEVMRLRKMIS